MSGSPLRSVLDAFDAGARSRPELARATGLQPDVVELAVTQLVRLGRLEAREMTSSCPTGGCGSCGAADDPQAACTSSAGSARHSGPVLLQLRRPTAGPS